MENGNYISNREVKLSFFTANFVKFHVDTITLNIRAKYTHQ